MAVRWSQHKYDIRKRPDQNELSKHCCRNHNLEKDLEVFILDRLRVQPARRTGKNGGQVHMQATNTSVQQGRYEQRYTRLRKIDVPALVLNQRRSSVNLNLHL